ncbi:MAG: Flp family type IVb pilin [Negativicutes bacterium]|nr:Flp family type IVb pilin [Negativicutes bacterium]
MLLLIARIHNALTNEKGQGMVEYGLILGLVTVLVIGSLTTIGTTIKGYFAAVVTAL